MDTRNICNYIDLCQGEFGRKVAYTDVQEITRDNVVKVLGNSIGIHNWNRPLIKYLYRYYKGDQPILYKQKKVRPEIDNRICENHALEVVRFKTSQTYGEPIQYVSKKKDQSINSQVDLLNDYMDDANAETRNIELGTYQSAIGTAYKAVFREEEWSADSGMVPFGIFIPDPLNTFVIYSSKNGKAMLSVQCLKNENGENYYLCYSNKQFFEIKNGEVVDYGVNGFGGIPVNEYPNNADRLSDIEIAITMFDTINNMQSQRMNGIEQFVQALMKFKNCEVDENKFLDMVKLGAICVKDTADNKQSDVDMMTSELNQSESQVAKDDLYHNMLIVEGMPDRQQNTGGDTGQAVYLRNGWDFAEQRAKIDEPFTREAEKRTAHIIINIISKTTKDVNLTIRDFDVKITRNPTDNMLVKAQALKYLTDNKIHPLIALITCGLFSDPQKVYEMSWPYMKSLYEELPDEGKQISKADELMKQFNNQTVNQGISE